jgi:predicted Fe-S protein YdhL (DUF1289 family)
MKDAAKTIVEAEPSKKRCISKCRGDPISQICLGCGRTYAEITSCGALHRVLSNEVKPNTE